MSFQPETKGLVAQYVTPMNAAVVGVVLVMFYVMKCRFWGSLRHLPGPWWSHYTQIPDYFHTCSGDRALYLHSLHQKYGDTVRVGPNFVGVTGAEAIKTVFGTSFSKPFSKDPGSTRLFNLKRTPGGVAMLGFNDPAEALKRRREYGNILSRGSVVTMQDTYRVCFENHIAKVETMRKNSSSGVVDILKCNRSLTLDVLTEAAFGGLYKGSEDPDRMMMLLTNTMKANLVQLNLGNFIYKLLMGIPWKGLDWVRSKEEYLDISSKATDEYLDKRREKPMGARKDIIGQLLTYNLPQETIESEVVSIIFGGTDTTANSATFTTIEILQHPEIHAKIVDELLRIFPEGEYQPLEPMGLAKIEECKYLTCVINEGLRRHPLAPGPALRLVPNGGSTINGHHIPGNVAIFAQSETANHDPIAFPDPYRFDPERWTEETSDMHAAFLSFGAGPRICPGESLAMMELHMLLGLLFRNYTVSLAPEGDTELMEFWLRTMKHGKLLVNLEPRVA